jgi:hypothetical protein
LLCSIIFHLTEGMLGVTYINFQPFLYSRVTN